MGDGGGARGGPAQSLPYPLSAGNGKETTFERL